MFLALMRKEFLLLRSAIAAALIIAVVMYGIVLPWIHFGFRNAPGGRDLRQELTGASLYALVLTTLLAAGFGGTASVERRERWADFAAMLPVSRARALAAKMIGGALLFVCLWVVHALVAIGCDIVERWREWAFIPTAMASGSQWTYAVFGAAHGGNLHVVECTAAAALAMFGLAWLLASFLRSPTLAFCGSAGAVLLGFVVTLQYSSYYHLHERMFIAIYFAAAATLGVVGLWAGTAYALRRVEP